MNTSKTSLRVTRGALVGALYFVLTYITSIFGLSNGAIQLRLSEALTILPIFMPEAVPGLFVGCIIANLFAPGVHPLDIVFGSLATLVGAVGTYLLRRIARGKLLPLATIPPIIANMIAVPLLLTFAYGAEGSYPFFVLTVGLSEIISCGILGTALGYSLKKVKF